MIKKKGFGWGNKDEKQPAADNSGAGNETPPAPAMTEAAPKLTEQEAEWKHRVHQKLLQVIDLSQLGKLDEQSARVQIREVATRIMADESAPLTATARQTIAKQVEDEVLGLGPLEPLLADPGVSDILINGPQSIYVEKQGKLEPTNVRFKDDAHLMAIIDRIVTRVGRRIDESQPMVDARLKDGSRVNAIIPPLALDGALVSIRRFAVDRMDPEDYIRMGSLTLPIVRLLHGAIKAGLNVLVSGGTGTGKTTLLNMLSSFIPDTERIITIEDSAELQLRQPHVCRLETRTANIEGKGEVNQRELVRNALRMRPDRIILGEVRSGEAFDMLQAMNTGHDGSLTTVHANTPRDALSRIENMVAMAAMELPAEAVRQQIASAIDVVIQLERMEDGKRRVVSVQEIQGMEGKIITMAEIFKFERRGMDEDGNVIGEHRPTGLVPKFHDKLSQHGIDLDFDIYNS